MYARNYMKIDFARELQQCYCQNEANEQYKCQNTIVVMQTAALLVLLL